MIEWLRQLITGAVMCSIAALFGIRLLKGLVLKEWMFQELERVYGITKEELENRKNGIEIVDPEDPELVKFEYRRSTVERSSLNYTERRLIE